MCQFVFFLRWTWWSVIAVRALQQHLRIVLLISRTRHDNRTTCSARVRHFANVSYHETHSLVRLQYLHRLVMCGFFEALAINLDYLISYLCAICCHLYLTIFFVRSCKCETRFSELFENSTKIGANMDPTGVSPLNLSTEFE